MGINSTTLPLQVSNQSTIQNFLQSLTSHLVSIPTPSHPQFVTLGQANASQQLITMRGLSMIAGVGLLMSLASAQQNDYNQYCNPPSNPPPEVQVEPGLYRKYHCDKSPSSSAYLGLPPVQASPDECTRQCAARVDHAKCSWSEGYCFFYGPSASITGHHGAIYVTYRKDQTCSNQSVDPGPG